MPKGALSSTAWGEGGCSHNSLLSCFNSVAKDYASAAKLCRCKACVYAMPKLGGGGGAELHIYRWEISSYHLLPASQAQPPYIQRFCPADSPNTLPPYIFVCCCY